MENKKIEINLGKAILIILIVALIIGGCVYYFAKNINSTPISNRK